MPLPDTSHLVGLIRKDKKSLEIQKNLDQSGEYQYISVISIFELTAGAYRSSHPTEKIQEIETFKENIEIIPVTSDFAPIYVIPIHAMQKKGSRKGALDELLAVTSLGFDGKIITRDSHFHSCP